MRLQVTRRRKKRRRSRRRRRRSRRGRRRRRRQETRLPLRRTRRLLPPRPWLPLLALPTRRGKTTMRS
jgi:hypothetical protein